MLSAANRLAAATAQPARRHLSPAAGPVRGRRPEAPVRESSPTVAAQLRAAQEHHPGLWVARLRAHRLTRLGRGQGRYPGQRRESRRPVDDRASRSGSTESASGLRAPQRGDPPAHVQDPDPGRSRALLAGLLRCGHCGRKLVVAYSGRGGRVPRYTCNGGRTNRGNAACMSLGGVTVERAVVEQVFEALRTENIKTKIFWTGRGKDYSVSRNRQSLAWRSLR